MPQTFKLVEATAARRRFYLYLVDATDGITPETGEAAGQPQVSVNGAGFGNTSATLTAIGNGSYYVELLDTELAALGSILVRYKSANTCEFQERGLVVAYDPYDAVRLGVTALPNAAAEAAGGLYTRGTGAGQIAQEDNGYISVNLKSILRTALTESVGGYLAAAFKKLFDVATPLLDASAAMRGTDGAALATDYTSGRADKLDNLDAAITTRSTLAAGAQMDLVNAPNATAVTAIQSGLGTAANQTTILARLGAWTGSARNTILGALQALFRSDADATVPSDINANLGGGAGDADNTTDSTEAIRDTAPLGTAMRGTDSAALASVCTETRLAELDAANLPTVLDTVALDVAGLDGAAMRGTDSAYTGTPPTAAAIADAVLDEPLADHNTEDSLGNVLNDLVDEDVGGAYQFNANALELGPGAGSAPTVADIDAELTSNHGAGSWASSAAGSGANTVTLTFAEADLTPAQDLIITVKNSAQTAQIGGAQTTDENGQVVFNLDDGSYKVIVRDNGSYAHLDAQDLTVSGTTTDSYTVVAFDAGTPTDPTVCRVYGWLKTPGLVAVSGGTITFQVNNASPTYAASDDVLLQQVPVVTATTDADGYFYADLVRSSELGGRQYRMQSTEARLHALITVPDAASGLWSDMV